MGFLPRFICNSDWQTFQLILWAFIVTFWSFVKKKIVFFSHFFNPIFVLHNLSFNRTSFFANNLLPQFFWSSQTVFVNFFSFLTYCFIRNNFKDYFIHWLGKLHKNGTTQNFHYEIFSYHKFNWPTARLLERLRAAKIPT